MSVSDRFANLKNLYIAIQDLDNAMNIEDPDILNAVLEAVKEIPKKDYPVEEQRKIIDAIRRSLIVLYGAQATEIGAHIGLDFSQYNIIDAVPDNDDEESYEVESTEAEDSRLRIPQKVLKEKRVAKEEKDERIHKQAPTGRYMGAVDDLEEEGSRDTRGGYLQNLTSRIHEDEDDYEEEEDERPVNAGKRKSSGNFIDDMMSAGRRKISDTAGDRKIITDQRREKNNY